MATTKLSIEQLTEKIMKEESKKIGEKLNEQPKVKVKVKASGKDDKAPVPVGINGYIYQVPKGVYVEVPEQVAQILEEADYI